MNHRLISWTLFGAIALTSCATPTADQPSGDPRDARYVEAESLLASDAYSDVQVLTSVPLQQITAAEAEHLIEPQLPSGVRTGRTGRPEALLLQGPGSDVAHMVRYVRQIDTP